MATTQELTLKVTVDAKQLSALSEGFSKLEKSVQNTAKTIESFSSQFDNIADNALQAADKIEKGFFERLDEGFKRLKSQADELKKSMSGLAEVKLQLQSIDASPAEKSLKGLFKDIKIFISENTLESLVIGLFGLLTVLGILRSGFLAIRTGAELFVKGIKLLRGRLGALIASISLVVANIVIWSDVIEKVIKNWDDLKDALTRFDAIKEFLSNAFNDIVSNFKDLGTLSLGEIKLLVEGAGAWFEKLPGLMLKPVNEALGKIKEGFSAVKDFLVGNSIVPETISLIGVNFAKLPEVMVKPTEEAVGNVVGEFNKIAEEVPKKVEDDLAEEFGTVPEAVYGKSQLNNTQRLSIIEAWL